MVVARAIVVIALAGGVCAQVRSYTMFDCSELLALLAERHGPACRGSNTLKELQWLLDRSLRCDDNHCTVRVQGASRLLIMGSMAEQALLVQRALEAVRTGTLEVRVQCTVFATPAGEGRALAAHKDVKSDTQAIDVVTAGRLIKETLAAGGTMRNLPETGAPPLVPFVASARPAAAQLAGGKEPAAQPATAADVPVRCVALVLGDDEVALAVSLGGEGAAAGDRFIRAKVGSGALLTFPYGTRTTCVWLRVVGLRPIDRRGR